MSSIQQSMQSLTEWLKANYPEGLEDLNPPATAEQLTALEQVLGFDLPKELRELLAIHNGQDSEGGYLFDGQEFLSAERIAEEWGVWKKLLDGKKFAGSHSRAEKGIRNDWWNAGWVPFTYNGCGDHFCVDTQPADGGVQDQIITMWHEMSERDRLANSLGEWLKSYTDDLQRGEFVYSDEFGAILHKDDV